MCGCRSAKRQAGETAQTRQQQQHTDKTFTRANVDPNEGIHWAGGHHTRNDFNKKKDPMVNWTEVLFRN